MILFSQLEEITGGKNILFTSNNPVATLSIDSRKASATPGTLFFAIHGERHNGHDYLPALYAAGIRQFVVEAAVLPEQFPEANILRVHSSVEALQKLATFHRGRFSYPVVGITGSNGKTIIKEWLYQMLSKEKIVVKNPGSYNSQIGVPLSVWQMDAHHQLAIFEAGISRPGEMEKIAQVMRPSLGIFTTIGSAHDEGFRNQEEKIREKLLLFAGTDTVVYCRDQAVVHHAISQTSIPTFSWGAGAEADVQVSRTHNACTVRYGSLTSTLYLPFSDAASVENCLHCVALLLKLGYDFGFIQDSVQALRGVPMRMELKEGIHQSQIVDDTYNNDLGGLEIALQFLTHQHQKKKKRVILSDILESGLDEGELVQKIATLVSKSGVSSFVGVGPVLSRHQHLFPAEAAFFSSTENFLEQFDFDRLQQEVILVKGARVFAFEKIARRLQRQVHGTVMEVDLNALVHNLNFFKSTLRPSTKIMVMVKAFAYGSGSTEIANLLQYHRADYLGVAYADEGVALRKNNIDLPIMVMNPSEESFDSIFDHRLEPEIYSFKIFHALLHYLKGKPARIHLKLDTGMHRLGFEESHLPEVIALLKANTHIQVASIFSHLAGADEAAHDDFSRTQGETFRRWADLISTALGYRPLYHVLNSPGILRLRELQFDMVRLGIGLYGVDPTSETHPLKPVATLKTIISQIKKINKGESIGYGRRGVAERDITIGTIAIGYADGFSRAFSRGAGSVLVQGVRASVIGNVCMDMTMIDITGIEAQEGDEVIIFGKGLPIQEVAASIQTIPYEILTNTSERVKRVFVADGI
ncbi:bifunctional UDP-N-acetylmuramoyl-tripeptide:D-alanyl-D-alanine ligase/alanine racemase [Chryseolinea lacunae]|uniref:Alanine racemase n=1 Tax=Chryseolinea lacunae TaxID=2801331 RepID=A0ABS1KQE8_9BACT|nr:bifunctional UDP-N-acetylmuramoyl-tripeptide:D-alanyl-D-alanine ligase/alanine racemase [Chryseolinea lacunae]MBL0741700.1 bifunctional UDP-N-acetylmuramoyl-tripeptide:D-alanyl-D-alanine ligase/alanine racemase [Chryseolinea lacunae]